MSAYPPAARSLTLPIDEAEFEVASLARFAARAAVADAASFAPAGPQGPLAFAGTGGPSVVIAPTTQGRTGPEILVNTTTVNTQNTPLVVTLSNGGFAVVWLDYSNQAASQSDIRAQVYTAAGVPVGGELLVNTATLNEQSEASVVALAGGGFVVAWRDLSQGVGGNTGDPSAWAIKGQIYDNGGVAVGSELLLNSSIDSSQVQPLLTALPSGGFVATWLDTSTINGDTSGQSIRGRVFDAAGAPLAADFLVNTQTASAQGNQAVTVLTNGGFVVTWEDFSGVGGDNSNYGIKAQVFSATGGMIGTERLVNTTTAGNQLNSEVVALTGGGFVVTWLDLGAGAGGATDDASGFAIRAQVFAVDGTPVLSEFLVNTATANSQTQQQITALASGGFVIAWQDYSAGVGGATGDTSGSAIKAQMYAADGTPVGGEFLVNTATAGDQTGAKITALSDGGFVITWSDPSLGVGGAAGDASASAVKAQVYDATGARSGGELLVNTAVAGSQGSPVVTALPNGGFVIAWTDNGLGVGGAGGDTSSTAIKAQVFGAAFTAVEQTGLSLKGLGFDVSDPDAGDILTVTLSVTYGVLDVTAGTSGAGVAGSGTNSVTLTGTAAQISALLNTDAGSTVSYTADTDAPPANTTVTLLADDGQGGTATTTAVIANVALNDAPVAAVNAGATLAEGAAVVVTSLLLDFNDADSADGNLTYTVTSAATNGVLSRDGVAVGLNGTFTQQDVNDGRIAYTHNGGETTSATFGFSVNDGAGGVVTGQSFAFDLTPVNDAPTANLMAGPTMRGTEILVNTATVNIQSAAQLTTLSNGGFVVVWSDTSAGSGGAPGDDSGSAVKAQVYAPSGTRIGVEILVNTATAGNQNGAQITALDGGGFVVTWTDSSAGVNGATGDASGTAVKAQVFDALGARVGTEIRVNTAVQSNQNAAQVTALTGGGFAVAWTDPSAGFGGANGDVSANAVKVQVFDALGATVGGEILANTATLGNQQVPQITALADGGFVVVWQDDSQGVGGATGDNSSTAIKAQVFGAGGTAVGGEILVNTAAVGAQTSAQLTPLPAGGFVVTWIDASAGVGGARGDTSSTAIKAQMFDANGDRVGAEFRVNTAISGAQSIPQITTLEGGGFVVVWQDASLGIGGANGDNQSFAVKAQAFDAEGAMVGTEILVNTAIRNAQSGAQITALADGGFVVTWQDSSAGLGGATGDASGAAIKAQVFDASGARVGGELRANTATNGTQSVPQITALPDGGFVVTWTDSSVGVGGATGDTSGTAVKAQVFSVGLSAIEQIPADFKARGFSVADVDSSALSVTLSVDYGVLTLATGTSGAVVSGSGTASVTITGTAAEINALLNTDATSTVTYTANTDAPPAIATLTLFVDDGGGGTTTTTAAVRLTAVADPGTAQADAFAVAEAGAVTGNVFADNGSGADSHPDSPTATVSAVNGVPASVGVQITLASGALLMLNADGTFAYDQNGAFAYLPGPASGASNRTATDSFTYTLAGGGTATVTLTITGVDSSGDILVGTAGDDILNGGAGIDTVDYSTAGSAVRAQLNDTIRASDGSGGFDTLISIENLTGSAFNDLLIGSNGDNVLNGGLGADTLLGLGGNDTLIGGAGAANQMQGGLGDDTYVVTANDTLIELADEGTDTVITDRASYLLKTNFENLTHTGASDFIGTGNGVANVMIGGSGRDTLNGMAGDDRLSGRGGQDILNGGQGIDTLDYSAAASGVSVRMAVNATLNDGDGSTDSFSGIENVTGSAFNDTLFGDAGSNVLNGGLGADILLGLDGNDTLIGGAGAGNTLQGGLGDDTYVVTANDTITEFSGQGIDTVQTDRAYFTLGANLENLTFTGAGAFQGVGNAENNVITGGAGADTLTGGKGNDTLIGGGGIDYVVLSGVLANYTVTDLGGGSYRIVDSVGGRDGTDVTIDVERVRFASGPTFALSSIASQLLMDGPQILPGIAEDDFLIGKHIGTPEVLPGIEDPFGTLDGRSADPAQGTAWLMLSLSDEGAIGHTPNASNGSWDHSGWSHDGFLF